MTEATPTLDPWGAPKTICAGSSRAAKSKGTLTMEEVVHVLRTAELTTEVIESVRARLTAEGIDARRVDAGGRRRAGRHRPARRRRRRRRSRPSCTRRATPPYAAGDFEEDGPELGGVRPARSAAAAPARAARGRVARSRRRLLRSGAHVPQGDRPGPAPHRAEEVEYSRRVEAGGFAATRLADLAASGELSEPRVRRAAGPAAHRPPRRGRPRGAHRGQPAPRRVDRQALRRPGHALPRPDPGGEPRPDAGGREVRLHEGLQVLHLRHVVDPPGHHPRHRRPGPHHPHPRAHGRVDQQGRTACSAR